MPRLALLLLCLLAIDAHAGLLEKLRPRYYDTRIDLHLGPRKVLSRAEFMAPYSEDSLLFLKTRGFFDGYQGARVEDDEAMDRRGAAFLIGKLVQFAEARHGRIFPEAEHDKIHVLVTPQTYGHLQAELALRSGLLRAYAVKDFWRRPITRYELAVMAGRALEALDDKLRIFRYHDGEPAARYSDLHAYPTLAYANLARALKTGVVEGASEDIFGGKEPVRGHEFVRTLRRLVLIALAYDPSA